jgi:hypothetical protein
VVSQRFVKNRAMKIRTRKPKRKRRKNQYTAPEIKVVYTVAINTPVNRPMFFFSNISVFQRLALWLSDSTVSSVSVIRR